MTRRRRLQKANDQSCPRGFAQTHFKIDQGRFIQFFKQANMAGLTGNVTNLTMIERPWGGCLQNARGRRTNVTVQHYRHGFQSCAQYRPRNGGKLTPPQTHQDIKAVLTVVKLDGFCHDLRLGRQRISLDPGSGTGPVRCLAAI